MRDLQFVCRCRTHGSPHQNRSTIAVDPRRLLCVRPAVRSKVAAEFERLLENTCALLLIFRLVLLLPRTDGETAAGHRQWLKCAAQAHAGRRWMASLIRTAAFIHATIIAT
jgi:hypothetical protein